MAKAVLRKGGVFGINEVNGVLGFFPGSEDAGAGIDAADQLAVFEGDAGIVGDDVAGLRKADADNEVAVVGAVVAVVGEVRGNGQDERDAGGNPVFGFGKAVEAGGTGAQAGKFAGEGGVKGPV